MPGQDLEKQGAHVLKVLNMAPTIPSNNSHEQLMGASEGLNEEPERGPTLRDVTCREWIAILILCFVNLINYMDRYTLAGILVDVQAHFDIDDGQAGLLQTSFVLSYMVFAPIFGYMGDRYSRKYIMTAGVFLWSLTTFLGSFMNHYGWFIMFRALVGIGEASYSTIAPTIISDLFVKDVRSKMLTLFYFAIPVGSGLGYIIGSETAKLFGSWHWALRVTPALGLVAALLILFVLDDPERGASEGSGHLKAGTLKEDLRELGKNGSFILSTAGFTCVAFVAGALAWWGPKLIALGISLQGDGTHDTSGSLSLIFGVITMLAGIVGLVGGCLLSNSLGKRWAKADPLICAAGLMISSPLLAGATFAAPVNSVLCYVLLFLGQVALNLNWAIVTDILLYVVLPTRRSTAEGVQLLVSHALGDAGSPYLIGLVSESLKTTLGSATVAIGATTIGLFEETSSKIMQDSMEDRIVAFHSLQYALFVTSFVEVIGGCFFLLNAFYIVKDKNNVELAVKGLEPTNITATETERSQLMS